MPVLEIVEEDKVTFNIVGGIAAKALHRVLAVGIEITPKKPLHLYSDGISLSIHNLMKRDSTRYRVIAVGINSNDVFFNADISVKGAINLINTLSTSSEEIKNAMTHLQFISDFEAKVGLITDKYIQDLADKETIKRRKKQNE